MPMTPDQGSTGGATLVTFTGTGFTGTGFTGTGFTGTGFTGTGFTGTGFTGTGFTGTGFTGTGFTGTTAVHFGSGAAAVVTAFSPTQVSAIASSGAGAVGVSR
jgi:hypothetical protein